MPRSAVHDIIGGTDRSGAYRLTQPSEHGGLGLTRDEFVWAVGEIAATDGSMGWLAAGHGLAAAALSTAAAELVWGTHPDALVAIGHHGSTQLTGGRLSGRWESVIGATHADWLLLDCTGGYALVPAALVEIGTRPRAAGLLRAEIGDVTANDIAVDRHDFCAADQVRTAAAAAAAVVGCAFGGLRQHVEHVRARLAMSYGGGEITDEAAAQIARAASDIDASQLQIAAADFSGGTAPYAQAIARARMAADRLMASSRHALDASDAVAAAWRDVHAGCRLAAALIRPPRT